MTAQILRTLDHVEVMARRLESVATLASTPATSLAAADARMSARLGLEPFLNAGFQLSVSLDHLQTWRHVVFAGGAGLQPAYAHMTLLRGAMEAAIVARWLVDSEVDPSERLARSADWGPGRLHETEAHRGDHSSAAQTAREARIGEDG